MQPDVWEGDDGKCQRCAAKYFSSRQQVDSTACIFHKGLYIDPGVARCQFSSSIWSCCKSADQNSIGCTHASSHVECQVTRKALSRMQNGEEKVGGRMAVELVDVQQEGEDREEERMAEGGEEGRLSHLRAVEKAFACSGKAAEHGDFLVHAYSHGETMPGLALRYGITVAEIQKANNFSHSSLDPGRKVLLIPRKPEKAGTTVCVSHTTSSVSSLLPPDVLSKAKEEEEAAYAGWPRRGRLTRRCNCVVLRRRLV